MESFLELRCVALKKADANSTQLNVFLIEAEEEKKRGGGCLSKEFVQSTAAEAHVK